MTFDLTTTDFGIVITHDLCDQSRDLSTTCARFQHYLVAAMSYHGLKPGVTGASAVSTMLFTSYGAERNLSVRL